MRAATFRMPAGMGSGIDIPKVLKNFRSSPDLLTERITRMLEFTKGQIKEIANHLDGDSRCYINPKTGEIVFWPDFEETRQDPEKYIQNLGDKRRAKYEESTTKWIQINGMRARDEIRVMEAFVQSVTLNPLRVALASSLGASKPFAAFRAALNSQDEWLQKWFAFKESAWHPWVMRQIEAHVPQEDEEGSDDGGDEDE